MAAGGVAAAAGRSGASEPGQVRDARATAPFLELWSSRGARDRRAHRPHGRV